jgi:hypothetical protein
VIDMPASYPSLIKTWTNKQDNIDDVFAGDINGAYDEIKAIETELMQVGYKRSVRAATTQDGALATAYANGQTIDGIVLTTGDRILIKDQTNGADNGIYTINASGAPTRATDANSANHMVAGLMVYVREGTINAKGTWKLTTTGAITLGTTPLTFENEVMAHLAETVTDIVNLVTGFEADPLGIIDASTALQNAIDSLPNGGEIYCPGKFLVGGLTVDVENITFKGRTKDDQLIIKNGTTGITISQNKVNFENFTIISQGTKDDGLNTNGILYEKTPANSIGFANLTNVDIKGFSGYGLKVINAIHFTYDIGYVVSCTKGIVFDRDAGALSFGTTVTAKRIYISSCTRGIDGARLYRSSLENVIAEFCDYGMYMNICVFTLYRCYFEANIIKGCYAVDCEIQDLYTYENNAVTDAVQVAYTGAVVQADRGYIRGHKEDFFAKRLGILSNYGLDVKYLNGYGGANNIGLKYGEAIVPLIRGKSLLDPVAWVNQRTSEFKGYDVANQGFKIQGVTAGDNTYGIKQDVTLDIAKQYVFDIASTTVLGSGIQNLKVGSLVVTNGVPFTPLANGVNTVKAYGIDTTGTTVECYINAISLCEVAADETYTAKAQEKLTANNQGRGIVYMSAAPTTGAWTVGEIVYNSVPATGGYIGWVCTAQGIPGTWKGFGLIA